MQDAEWRKGRDWISKAVHLKVYIIRMRTYNIIGYKNVRCVNGDLQAVSLGEKVRHVFAHSLHAQT